MAKSRFSTRRYMANQNHQKTMGFYSKIRHEPKIAKTFLHSSSELFKRLVFEQFDVAKMTSKSQHFGPFWFHLGSVFMLQCLKKATFWLHAAASCPRASPRTVQCCLHSMQQRTIQELVLEHFNVVCTPCGPGPRKDRRVPEGITIIIHSIDSIDSIDTTSYKYK